MNLPKSITTDEYQQGYIEGHREMARTVNQYFADEFETTADKMEKFAKFIRGAGSIKAISKSRLSERPEGENDAVITKAQQDIAEQIIEDIRFEATEFIKDQLRKKYLTKETD